MVLPALVQTPAATPRKAARGGRLLYVGVESADQEILDRIEKRIRVEPSSRFKVSYYYDADKAPTVEEITDLLHQEELTANVLLSFGQFLDVIPSRASKGQALRYMALRLDIPLENILVAGGSGADEDMMRGNTSAVLVANRHHEELSGLVDLERVYLSDQAGAAGLLDAIDHYDFLGAGRAAAD